MVNIFKPISHRLTLQKIKEVKGYVDKLDIRNKPLS